MYLLSDSIGTPMTMTENGGDGGGGLSKSVAVVACTAMAAFYVAILYAPTAIFRLPPPNSFKSFMIRRFVCAAVSSVVSLVACFLILPIRWGVVGASDLFHVYGIRTDHIWQAVAFPLSLTSLIYAGSLILKFNLLVSACAERWQYGCNVSLDCIKAVYQHFISEIPSLASNISAWRNYFVAPLTEELVFRACMIPLLLCGGFTTYTVVFLCPVFFSLAHFNHFVELCIQQNCDLLRAAKVVGFQIGYTAIFGSYASFLFVRTGHLIAALVAHIFCNYMGLPLMFSRQSGAVGFAFMAGVLGFFWFLFPLTNPHLYNDRIDNCHCWQRFCSRT